MVVNAPTQQLLKSGRRIACSRILRFGKRSCIYNVGELIEKLEPFNNRLNVRLCVRRLSYSFREPRATLGKLSPHEVFIGNISGEFYNPQCGGFGVSCLNCHVQKFCMGNMIWSNTTCRDNFYCDPETSRCTNVLPSKCGIECPQPDGIFPDGGDCTKYFKCTNNVSTIYKCPSRYIYNHTFKKCVLQLENSDCKAITCSGSLNGFYLNPDYPSLYYECLSGVLKLNLCPQNEEFDLNSKSCVSVCKNRTGLISDPSECTKFISCSSGGPVKKRCPPGYGFNPIFKECQLGLEKLCFEITIFNKSVPKGLPSYVRNIIRSIKTVLVGRNILGWLFKMGVPADFVSDALLVLNYFIVNNFRIPPLLLELVVENVLNVLPENMKNSMMIPLSLFKPL